MKKWIFLSFGCLALLMLMQIAARAPTQTGQSCYISLPPDTSTGDPLAGLRADFTPTKDFSTNLPIVILTADGVIPRYDGDLDADWKTDTDDGVPKTGALEKRWVSGHLRLIDTGTGVNTLADAPAAETDLVLRRRGHSSMQYDKPQYLLKAVTESGEENPVDLLGMGAFDRWILNGSLADKSMLRNYLAYRIASEIQPETPDCRFCEVFLEQNGTTVYQGVYLLMENIARGENRIPVEKTSRKYGCTGYILRRDRYNRYDTMLDTYARKEGLCPEDQWIGLKYPGKSGQSPAVLSYITQDYSQVEKVVYSEDPDVFKTYGRYLDAESFADYFLINEFFGNYDSGDHSTILWKNPGGKLRIGPVWDFDQAMNNVYSQEQEPQSLAMTQKPIFRQLLRDWQFVALLENRYARLRRDTLSEEHVLGVIDEAIAYLRSAQKREWFRWRADYLDGSGNNHHNYYLAPYQEGDVTLNRFTREYDQACYVIRAYLRTHGQSIAGELKKLEAGAELTSGPTGQSSALLAAVLLLFAAPSLILFRRGG